MEQYSIGYAPSVAVYLIASPLNAAAGTGSVLVAANRTPYASLPELRHAALEVEEAAKRLPGAEVRVGSDAVRRHIVRRKGELDILHLACHGEFDRYDPLMSRVCLADGSLTDIYFMWRPADEAKQPHVLHTDLWNAMLVTCELAGGDAALGGELLLTAIRQYTRRKRLGGQVRDLIAAAAKGVLKGDSVALQALLREVVRA